MNKHRITWWKATLKTLTIIGCSNGHIKQKDKSTITFTFKLEDHSQYTKEVYNCYYLL